MEINRRIRTFTCACCGKEMLPARYSPEDWFMVKNKLWLSYFKKTDIVCTSCFEKKLGRPLESSDLLITSDGHTPPINFWILRKYGMVDHLEGIKKGYPGFKEFCEFQMSCGNEDWKPWLEEYEDTITYLENYGKNEVSDPTIEMAV